MRRATLWERPRRRGSGSVVAPLSRLGARTPSNICLGGYHDCMDPLPTATSTQGPATTTIAKPMRLRRPEAASEVLGVPVATLNAWPGTPRAVDRKACALCAH